LRNKTRREPEGRRPKNQEERDWQSQEGPGGIAEVMLPCRNSI
jgi:hypothetical protein